jgi:hypothetical protein
VQKRENPYTPGAGRKPPMLAGRDGHLEDFQALIERAMTVVKAFSVAVPYLTENHPLETFDESG